MLIGALAVFTLVAAMGLMMVLEKLQGRALDSTYPMVHGGASLLGSGLVIAAALEGDLRLYVNIVLAVVIILLGVYMGVCARRGKPVPKAILASHIGLAVVCYGILALFAVGPRVDLLAMW
ncbi:MAG: hypothetical protein ACR2HF_09200 [Methylococcaceae bacterium]